MKRARIIFILFSILAVVFSSSCDVGLGEAVDTDPPKVVITYPPIAAVVRGEFVLAGTCTDDRGVAKIVISIVKDNKTPEYEIPPVEIKDGRTWTTRINAPISTTSESVLTTEKYPLSDGTYTFTAVAYDDAGRESSKYTQTFDIDNTAPFFVLSEPSSIDVEKPSSYGTIVRIKGDIAEAHSVKYITLFIYDENNKILDSWPEKEINTNGGTSVNFARYSNSLSDELKNRYTNIYKIEKGGDQKFSVHIEMSDSAMEYTEPVYDTESARASATSSKNNSKGNVTTSLWLNDSIFGVAAGENALLGTSAATVNDFEKSFEMGELMAILNGSSKDECATKVETILNNTHINTVDKHLPIKLNYMSNPYYTIMGYPFNSNSKKEDLVKAQKSGLITLKADCGLDRTNFNPSNLIVYRFGPYDDLYQDTVKEIYNNPRIYHEKNTTKGLSLILFDGAKDYKDGGSVSTYTKELNLTDDVVSSKVYIVAAVGKDLDGLDFVSLNGSFYGFMGFTNTTAPEVIVKATENSNDISEVLKFRTTITSADDAGVNTASYSVVVTDVLNGKELGTIECANIDEDSVVEGVLGKTMKIVADVDIAKDYEKGIAIWKPKEGVTKNENPLKEKEGVVYKYTITVTGSTAIEGRGTASSQYDSKKPEISISDISKPAKSEEKDGYKEYSLNQTVRLKASIDELSIDNVSLILHSLGEKKEENWTTIDCGTQTYFEKDIDTTKYADKDFLVIRIVCKDKAGNEGVLELNNSSASRYYVDQSTDIPVIELTNASDEILNKDSVGVGANLFDQTGNNKIMGNITDDDKLKSVTVEYSLNGTNDWKKIYEKPENNSTHSLSAALQKSLTDNTSLDEGIYYIKISAVDDHDISKTVGPFCIGIDNQAPVIYISNQNNAFQDPTNLVVSGTLNEGSGVVTLERTGLGEPKEITLTPTGEGSWKWTDEVGEVSESKTITYTATDKYGRQSKETFDYRLDLNPPEVIVNGKTTVYLGATNTTNMSFNGTAKDIGDEKNSSGIAKVQYRLGSSVASESSWIDAIGTSDWNCSINFASNGNVVEGEEKVYFRSVDNAGRTSAEKVITVIKDNTLPVVTIEKIKKDGNEISAIDGVYYLQDMTFSISGKVVDANLEKLTANSGQNITFTNEAFTDVPITVSGVGSFTLVLTAEDKAGQIGTAQINVFIDKISPTVSTPEIMSTLSKDYGETTRTNVVNGQIKIKANATDNDKVVKMWAEILGTSATAKQKEIAGSSLTWDVNTTELADNAGYKLKVYAIDRAGMQSNSEVEFYVDQATDIPVITLTNASDTITETGSVKVGKNLFDRSTNKNIMGSITDDDKLKSVVAEYSKDGTTDWTKFYENTTLSGSSFTLSVPLQKDTNDTEILAEGTCFIRITATDEGGKSKVTPVFCIGIDEAAPVISFTELDGGAGYKPAQNDAFQNKTGFTLKGEIKEGSGIASFKRTKTGGSPTTISLTLKSGTTDVYEWTDESGEISTSGTLSYEAKDIYGRSMTLDFNYKVDTDDPSITLNAPSNEAEVYLAAANSDKASLSVNGTATDEGAADSQSGVKEIRYLICDSSGNPETGKSWENPSGKANGTTSWFANIEFAKDAGEKKVKFRSVDNADRMSSEANIPSITVKVDKVLPVISITSVTPDGGSAVTAENGKYYINKNKVAIAGTATDTYFASLKYGSTPVSSASGSFTHTIDSLSDGDHEISFVATDKAEQTKTETIKLYVDTTPPTTTVEVSTLLESSLSGTGRSDVVNGTITIKASADDADKVVESWVVIEKSPGNAVYTQTPHNTSSPKNFTITVNTTTLEDDATYTVKVYSKDRAGNVTATPGSMTIYVDQDTDLPTFELNNAEISTKSETEGSNVVINENNNLFSDKGKISLMASDDDGIGSITLYHSTDKINWPVLGSEISGNGKTTQNVSVPLTGLSEGVHYIKVEIKDKHTNGDAEKTNSTAGEANIFCIGIDNSDPTLKIDTPSGGYSNGTLDVSGKASDANGIKSLVRTGLGVGEPATIAVNSSTGAWTDSISGSTESGTHTLTYTATDKYGKTTSQTFEYTVDVAAPKITDISTPTAGTFFNSKTVQFMGTASDEENGSGLLKVQYKVGTGDWKDANGTANWSCNITFDGADGAKTVEFRAIDKADNKGANNDEIKSITVNIDTVVPAFSAITLTPDSGTAINITDASVNYINKSKFTITGTLTETNFKLFTYSLDGTDKGNTSTASGAFPISLSSIAEGSHTIVLTATDKANQVGTVQINVFVDTVAPTIDISEITPTLDKDSRGNSNTNVVNGTIRIKANATDADKVGKIWAEIGDSLVSGEKDGSSLLWENIATNTLADKTVHTIKVFATDRTGNTGESTATIYVDQATDKPVITFNNVTDTVVAEGGINANTNLFDSSSNNIIKGTISDDDKLSSVEAYYASTKSVVESGGTQFFAATPSGSTYSLSIPLKVSTDSNAASLAEGIYYIRIVAKDDNSTPVETSKVFCIGVDDAAPVIDIQTQKSLDSGSSDVPKQDNAFQSDNGFTLKGIITETSTVTLTRTGFGAEKTITPTGSAPTFSWEDTIKAEGSGKLTSGGTITYTATDKYGRTSSKTFTYKIDSSAPEVSVTTPADASYYYLARTKTNKMTASGTANDTGEANSQSGIKSVQYSLDDGANWTNLTGTTTWYGDVEFTETSDSTKTVQFRSVDNSGKLSTAVSRTVVIDNTLPAFSALAVKVGDAAKTADNGTYYLNSNAFIVGGTLTETNFKLFTYSLDGTDKGSVKDSSGDFSIPLTSIAEGSHTIVLTATDLADQSASQTINVFVDLSAPSPSVELTTNYIKLESNRYTVNGLATVRGRTSDNDKIARSWIEIKKDGESTATKLGADETNDVFTRDIVTTTYDDKSNYTITIHSIDRAGNEGTSSLFIYVDQSTDVPELTCSNATDNSTGGVIDASQIKPGTNLFSTSGNNKLIFSMSDDDKLKSFSINIAGGDSVNQTTNVTEVDGRSTTAYTYTLPDGKEGIFTITATLQDEGYASAENKTYHQIVKTYIIAVDSGAPKFSITSQDNAFTKANNSAYKIEGKVTDSCGDVTIYCYDNETDAKARENGTSTDNGLWTSGNAISGTTTEKTWSHNYTTGSQGKTLHYVAVDKYKQATRLSFRAFASNKF